MSHDTTEPGIRNERTADKTPDAHGQAALLLAESILHTLVQTMCFTTEDAITTVETAVDVKVEIATVIEESQDTMLRSIALLNRIRNSLITDQRDHPNLPPHS